ncbi:MAG: hypothetical protein AMDU5_GPLC00018G0014 [Thermoplasmatales archaeon Gpl]|nr:MAG: hypothetical protein AMDU5_GPLC00018G0014 [Thermoplasmatales archaeon Gpl]
MSKTEVTTIQLDRSVVEALKRIKKYPRETYNETILNLSRTQRGKKEITLGGNVPESGDVIITGIKIHRRRRLEN